MAPSGNETGVYAQQTTIRPADSTSERLLLLSPPSISSHPDKLNKVLESHRRDTTDLQMLDRLAAGLVSLPKSTYDIIILLSDADGTRRESFKLLNRPIFQLIARSLRPGGIFRSEDGSLGTPGTAEHTEAILAGLVVDDSRGLVKPDFGAQESVPLRLERRNGDQERAATPQRDQKRSAPLQGVGFVDFSDDVVVPSAVKDGSDDELIDEEELLDEDDMGRPIVQPPECRPGAGKRRRACKDCTCGLAQKLEAEDKAKRTNADKALETMVLQANELAEVDFTVQGKVGSCGNCALGDAFRCDGCPYIGLPPFKPGEEVRLLNNDVQL
ncbi:hypothetical protein VTO42DRAFT_3388 [Malbranchea cinnamomea]